MRIYYTHKTGSGRYMNRLDRKSLSYHQGSGYVPLLLQPGLGSSNMEGTVLGNGMKPPSDFEKKQLYNIGEKLKNLKIQPERKRNITFTF